MRFIRPVDAMFAALLMVTGLLEVALTDVAAGGPAGTAVLVVVAAAAMLVRTAQPVVCLAITVSLVLVAHVPGTGLALSAALVVGCLLALGSVGRFCREAVSIATALGTVTIFVVSAAFAARPWDVVVAVLACGSAWAAGRMLRKESMRSARLRSLTAELVAQRESQASEAVRAERIRIARELHDTVAHTVSVMTLQVGGVRRRLDGDPGSRAERDVLLDVEALGREAVAELQRMLDVLRSPDDASEDSARARDPQPRLADVERLVERVRAAGVPVELEVEGTTRELAPGVELVGYRVVQEALTNVLKHSPGAGVEVHVSYSPDCLELSVRDDGPAATTSSGERAGLGLTGIRERVALYGGHVEAGPTGHGFRVRATLPTAKAGGR